MDYKRHSEVPEIKKKAVEELKDKMNNSKTILIASTKSLPGRQFHQIKKKLRDDAEVRVSKKTILFRAIDETKNESLATLKEKVSSDFAIFFSDKDAFELSGKLTDNQSPTRAKAGDIVNEDISIEAGPTDLLPGPAISELSGVGLKVAVENGKLAIKQGATVVKKGEAVTDKVASVLGKLNIMPMKVGFIPVAAYDSKSGKTYSDIVIDKPGTLVALREAIAKSLSFSINVKYVNEKNVGYFIAKAGIESMALEKLIESKDGNVEEKKEEEKPVEQVQESNNDKEVL